MLFFYKKKKGQPFNRWLLFCLFASIFFLLPDKIKGQNNAEFKRQEVAIGISLVHEKLPEGYDYTPLFITGRFPVFQFSSNKKNKLNIFAEPQLIWNNAPKPFNNSFEFGLNLGLQYFLPLSNKIGLAASIGVGPHFLSLETDMQAKGFIFSDNFEFGYYQKIGKQWGICLKPRFRHLSNAGLQSPNIGIDNFFVMVGIFRFAH